MLKDNTYKAYSGLAKYCRTGNQDFVEGVNLRQDRLHHYRRLVFNITNNTLKQAYPITFKLLSESQWRNLVDDFFINNDAQEYRVWQMPKELYVFAKEKAYQEKYEIPFLLDLLLFEWIEIEVHTMEDEIFPVFKEIGNVWTDKLVLNPEFRLLQLEYPVHIKKTKEITIADKGNYFLLAYRQIENQAVHFMNLSVLYAFIIEQIEASQTLKEIMDTFCSLTHTKFESLNSSEIEAFIETLLDKKVVLGFSN